jgi:4-amino-4-deoxy-L-arabinose transferase-like glycosyltransferase
MKNDRNNDGAKMEGFFHKFSVNLEEFAINVEKNYKIFLLIAVLIGFILRFYAVFVGLGSNHYSKIDELEAYIWGQQLRYYGHPRFFTYIPGPYLSLIAFLLIKFFNTVKSLYYFWVFCGTLSIYLVFWLSKKIFSHNFHATNLINKENKNLIEYPIFLSILIALLFAIFPWSIKYTVSYWNPHFIIIFSTLLLGYLFDVLTKEKSKNIFGLILTVAVMPFFHMIIIYAVPVIFLMIIIRKRILKLNYPYLILGLFISILIWIPFFIFDKNTNFFILNSYLHHESVLNIRPETLKMIVNPILITTLDISRFTGHYFFEYKYFLDRAYGLFFIGLIPVICSIIIAIYSFIISFKYFSFKLFNKDNINPITYLLLFMVGTLFFHLLSLQVHEDRYTVIFFAIPYIILGYGWYKILFNSKSKRTNLLMILSILVLICLILAPYITISHFYQERYPNFENKVRLIPSLIYYEKIKYFVIKDFFQTQNILDDPKSYINFIDLDRKTDLPKFHSLFDYESIKKLFRLNENKNSFKKEISSKLYNTDLRYIFSLDNIYIEKDPVRQKQIIKCIERFINTNTNLIADEKDLEKLKKNNIQIIYLKFYSDKSQIPDNFTIIGKLPNAFLVKTTIK